METSDILSALGVTSLVCLIICGVVECLNYRRERKRMAKLLQRQPNRVYWG